MSPSDLIEPCLRSPRHPAPTGLHPIKHDVDLLMARRDAVGFLCSTATTTGAPRYPLIVEAVTCSRCGPASSIGDCDDNELGRVRAIAFSANL
jgi:hypothetical protein